MTAGQQAILDGFNVNLAEHGQTWTRTSDGAVIQGIANKLEITRPEMKGSQDRDIAILVSNSDQPVPVLKRGDELAKTGVNNYFRVTRADYDEATTIWTVCVSPSI